MVVIPPARRIGIRGAAPRIRAPGIFDLRIFPAVRNPGRPVDSEMDRPMRRRLWIMNVLTIAPF